MTQTQTQRVQITQSRPAASTITTIRGEIPWDAWLRGELSTLRSGTYYRDIEILRDSEDGTLALYGVPTGKQITKYNS